MAAERSECVSEDGINSETRNVLHPPERRPAEHPLSEISEFPHTGEFRAPSVSNAAFIDAILILFYHDMWAVKDAHNLSF